MKKSVLLSLVALIALSSCTRIITNKMADGLSATGGSPFTRDSDPELMADALPLALKLYETMLEQAPDHVPLHRATASAFTSYSYAFIQFPADTLPYEEQALKDHMLNRSKNMYLRARGYGLDGLEIRYPGFMDGIRSNIDSTLALTTEEDVDILYWTGLSWMGAFNASLMKDMRLMLSVPKAVKIMSRVAELDPEYGNGAIDEFYIAYYGGMPKASGGDPEKALEHFNRAVELTEGKSAGPYLAYATTVLIATQDRTKFEELMKIAKRIKPSDNEDDLLLRTIQRQKAVWYLEHIDDFFI